MMDEQTRRDVVEAMEALERAKERWIANPGSAHVHMTHALVVLYRILEKHASQS